MFRVKFYIYLCAMKKLYTIQSYINGIDINMEKIDDAIIAHNLRNGNLNANLVCVNIYYDRLIHKLKSENPAFSYALDKEGCIINRLGHSLSLRRNHGLDLQTNDFVIIDNIAPVPQVKAESDYIIKN